ncbi:MAG: hypothetical protein GY812_06225 [Actinomycetia bacterium]|nr:hypothetical protein [Actinomycetes bacterium]
MSRIRPRRRTLPGAVLALAAVLMVAVGAPAGAAAGSAVHSTERQGEADDAEQLATVEAASAWVEPDGTFSVTLAASNAAPPGSTLTWTVGQRISPGSDGLRAATEDVIAGNGIRRTLQAPRSIAFDELAPADPPAGSTAGNWRVLDVPIRSGPGDSESLFVPNAGIHPVRLELADPAGEQWWETTVFLNRLPEELPTTPEGTAATTAVQLLASLDSGPTLSPDGTASVPTDEQPTLSSIQSLLTESLDLPLTVALRPNTMLGLQRSASPADQAFVASVAESAWNVVPQTYVRVDAAALGQAPDDEFTRQVEVGAAINGAFTGRDPVPLWMLDDTLDEEAARILSLFGVSHLMVSEDRLVLVGDDADDSRDLDDSIMRNRSVALEGFDSVAVSTYDAELTRLMVEPGTEAALAAHRVVTALMSEWFAAASEAAEGEFPPLSAAVLLTPGVSAETVAALTAPLLGDGPLRVGAPPPPETGDDAPLARLGPLDPPDFGAMVRRTTQVGAHIQGWRSMAGSTDPTAGELDLINDQTVEISLDQAARTALWNGVLVRVDAKVAQISVPPPRTIVLTSRTGSIPLRFGNATGQAVRLLMRTRSPRLDFPDGPVREIVLVPGENRVDIPVEVQAPGSSVLRIELSSPDTAITLPDTSVTVRSSSISGVGAALSGLSILVLAVWWIRTHRSRRNGGSDPGGENPTQDTADAPDGGAGAADDTASVSPRHEGDQSEQE